MQRGEILTICLLVADSLKGETEITVTTCRICRHVFVQYLVIQWLFCILVCYQLIVVICHVLVCAIFVELWVRLISRCGEIYKPWLPMDV